MENGWFGLVGRWLQRGMTLRMHLTHARLYADSSVTGNVNERAFSYWPSYTTVTSTARLAYLNWLAEREV